MKNRNKILAWTLLLAWMSVIFFMSNQPAEISNNQSDLVIKIFESLGLNLSANLGDLATLVVRKGAHMTEYFILYILAYRVIDIYIDNKNSKKYALLFVFIYACSDELHQSFVPGRAMAFKDVLIDTTGAAIGMMITSFYEKYKEKYKEKIKKTNKKLIA